MKAIVYYACNTHKHEIDRICRNQLMRAKVESGVDMLYAVSLNESLAFGDRCITLHGAKSPLMMHRQILEGLSCVPTDDCTVFLCESDVLYSTSHFDFAPLNDSVFYYNTNVWRVRWKDGHAVWTDDLQQVSGCCASKNLLFEFYSKRVLQIESAKFNRHFEPGVKQTVGGQLVKNRQSEHPNLCIRHDNNLTQSKWSPDEFRNTKYARGWKEADEVFGWGGTKELLRKLVDEVT